MTGSPHKHAGKRPTLAVARLAGAVLLVGGAIPAPAAAQTEIVAAIQTRGNVATSDEELRRLTGVEIGSPVTGDIAAQVAGRLRATRRFESVEVLKRYASIADPSQIVLVVIVDEGPVRLKPTNDPANPMRAVKKRLPALLFSPILGSESGYGLTYGALLTRPEPTGKESRIAFPLTWGAQKRAGANFEQRFPESRWMTRLEAGGSVSRRINPLFGVNDDRAAGYVRAERSFTRALRIRGAAGWQNVAFGADADHFTTLGGEAVFDTRLDPFLARNAVYLRAARSHLRFGQRGDVTRTDLEAHGYLGLPGQAILVASARSNAADAPLPDYLKPLLGGPTAVRGFKTGTAAGDSLLVSSLEVRVPLTSPLSFGKIGVSGFVDAGAVSNAGERLLDQPFRRSVGGSLWFTAAVFRINVAVARGIGSSTRVQMLGSLNY